MDHFPRFRRNKKDTSSPIPTLPTLRVGTSGTTTPPPGNPEPDVPARPRQKLSPFRGFHLRPSHKRARDSPPATPVSADHGHSDKNTVAARPTPARTLTSGVADETTALLRPLAPPKIPEYLELNAQKISSKFHRLVELERFRFAQSFQNPSADFRWARVVGPHLRLLDRYMNIQPWENNRVKLQVPDGHVDYINASPIVMPVTASRDESLPAPDREPDRYIAMQGPKQVSADHVWRMVAEQVDGPGVIVMLTETHEAHMEKCFQYFPRSSEEPPREVNYHDEFGDGFRAIVRCEGIEETPAGDAIELRKLVMRILPRSSTTAKVDQHAADDDDFSEPTTPAAADPDSESLILDQDLDVKMRSPPKARRSQADEPDTDPAESQSSGATTGARDGQEDLAPQAGGPEVEAEERVIWHFLYKKWPDFGVPNLTDLDGFFTLMRLSREKNAHPANPRIVHCSAGVGRSGTFIALEHLIRELNSGALENYSRDERAGPRRSSPSPSPDGGDGGAVDTAEPAEDEPPWPLRQDSDENDPIFRTVNRLREQRRTMVQAEPQYLFIYQVMRKLWQDKYGVAGDENEAGEPAAKRLEVDPFIDSRPE